MNPIIFPLKMRLRGADVANLQAALKLLLERKVLLRDDDAGRGNLVTALQREQDETIYGPTTAKAVSLFQELRHLPVMGAVDEATAAALNGLLRELGALTPSREERSFVVTGQVRREDGVPVRDVRLVATHEGDAGAIRLGVATADAEGRYTIRYAAMPGVDVIKLRVTANDVSGKTLVASSVIAPAKPIETIDLQVPMTRPAATEGRIEGQVTLENGSPAEGMKLRLYRRDFGGAATMLTEITTLEEGKFVFTYDTGGKPASLEARIVDAANTETVLTKPLNELNGAVRSNLNLIAPASLRPLAAEYRRLTADLTPIVGQMGNLAGAKETTDRQDLTVLNRATGWDARLIALAATTEQLSADPDVNLPKEPLYGLLRSGLPSDKLMLAQVEPSVVEKALKKVREAGIVGLTDAEIAQFVTAFTASATKIRLAVPAPGSRSTYGELLKASGLNDAAQAKFAPVYLSHRGEGAELWAAAKQAGLADGEIGKLQMQGKLAYLAGNSSAMTARLVNKGLQDPAELVGQDFHLSDAWAAEVFEQAGVPPDRRAGLNDADRENLKDVIPAAYAGDKVENRLKAYADDMARKVRLSYPTQVLGRRMETDPKFKLADNHAATVTLLKNAATRGFKLGTTPAAAFLKANPGAQGGLPDADFKAASQSLRTLQSVYQITPTDEAMPVLMSLGMNSAFDVMAYPEEDFERYFVARHLNFFGRRPSKTETRLVYQKSKQVSSITYNLFTIAKTMASAPQVAGMSPPIQAQSDARDSLLKHYPTLESVFGSMDYCECEHCRSVLSPAAYLVDLLQFVDTENGVWGNFLAHWEATHGGDHYQIGWDRKPDGTPRPEEERKPYDALIERRPDIPRIALTCENTLTAMPYIDIVNEILEYYVANDRLDETAAHDTEGTTTEELLSEPQNVIREAYDKVRGARYPMNLPFDLWIETTRQFCAYFETPLQDVLEVFRPTDDLLAPAQPYDRAAIFLESLGLAPAEASIFTDPNPLPKWHELYGFADEAKATTVAIDPETKQRIDLNSAKALSRRLGVTYKELAEIIRTGFVNPELSKSTLLYKLGLSIRDAQFYLAHKALATQDPTTLADADQKKQCLEAKAFLQDLTTFATTFISRQPPGGPSVAELVTQLDNAIQAIRFGKVLVLADPDAGCDFDKTTLQYADDRAVDDIALLRINLFVRLWRKLGWTIEETDRALQTFVPKNTPYAEAPGINPNANLASQPLRTALIYIAHLATLDGQVKVGKQSRHKLLTLWSDIPANGRKPLYAQLFLTRNVLKGDPVFDHPLGGYLSKPNVRLQDHLIALQGALSLTADDVGRILTDAGKALDTAELSLPNVSLLYRYGLLAKALKLDVPGLIALKQLSGLDPFKAIPPDPIGTLDQDAPFSQTLEFVKVALEIKEAGLHVEDLDYLLRHHFDETGKYRPDREARFALLQSIAEGVRGIRDEHAVPADPGSVSNEALRQKLGLVLPVDVAQTLAAMLDGAVEFTAVKRGVASGSNLDPAAFSGEAAIQQVVYNETRQEQKLTFRGVLFDAQKTDLKARLPKPSGNNPQVPSPLFSDLMDDVQQQAHAFFDKHLLKQPPGAQPAYGFLDAADFDPLFKPMPDGSTEAERQARERDKRARLATAFLPFLQQRLIRQFIVQTMAAHSGVDATLVESLVTDSRLLAAPAALLSTLASTADRGLTATFFASVDATGPALTTIVLAEADTAAKDGAGNPLMPATAKSSLLEGYLKVATDGAYRFLIDLDKQNAEAELQFSHLPDPTFVTGTAQADHDTIGDQPDEFLELKAGVAYRFTLVLKRLNGGHARLDVQGESLARGPLSQLTLYSAAAMDGAERAVTLLDKSVQILTILNIEEREIRYLLTHAPDFGNLSLSELPTERTGDTQPEAAAAALRFSRFRRLAAYARLKRDLAGGTDDLIGVFEANGTAAADRLEKQVYPLIARLSRREAATVKATAEVLSTTPAFAAEPPLQRLWDALQVVERFGMSPASLQTWTGIVGAATPKETRFEIAKNLRETIKARFDAEAWLRVAKPIFDKLRQLQRDALVSYTLTLLKLDRLEQLYEYFLIDPGMEPVVQTSRIRLAIGSVQLFIQRCLLNLERRVHPSTINARQWEWMKRYRVWEANRKIFLFPENWLEPEFRDDKTHLFTELEGALLQGDVSSDLVEDSFLNYLRKLDELARLDIVAMHIEDNADPALRVLHVFGRTYSQPHKYFYRRYAHQAWTPWEPVSAEIDGDHLAPVVWRDRLYLFWVTFMDRMPNDTSTSVDGTSGSVANMSLSDLVKSVKTTIAKKLVDVELHWSEYVKGEWTTRESGGPGTKITQLLASDFQPMDTFIHVTKETYDEGEERGVFINLGGAINQAFYLAGRNSAPEMRSYMGLSSKNPFDSANQECANRYKGTGALRVSYNKTIVTEKGRTLTPANEGILQQVGAYTLLPCDNDLTALGASPDAYQGAANPEDVKKAIESGLAEIASLMKPVFYQDNRTTLFVEPDITEQTVEEWKDWVKRTTETEPAWADDRWWRDIEVRAALPAHWPPPDPRVNIVDKDSLISPVRSIDWLLNPTTAVKFGEVLIGRNGQPGIELANAMNSVGARVSVNPGSGLGGGRTVVLSDAGAFAGSGLRTSSGGLNVVGAAGFNSALVKNLTEANGPELGAGALAGVGVVR